MTAIEKSEKSNRSREFEALEAALAEARVRLQDAQAHRGDRVRALEAAESALHEHVVGVHAGEREADAELEDRLGREARKAGEVVAMRLVNYGQTSEAMLVDLKAEARVAGAEQAVVAAEEGVRSYAQRHWPELAAELIAGPSRETGVAALAALSASFRAMQQWNKTYARWAEVMRWAGTTELLQSVPQNPFAGLQRPGERVEHGPVPGSLLRG